MTTTIGIVRQTRQLRQSGPIFSFTQFSFDPATVAWVAAVVAAGGTVSNAREVLVNNLILGLKSDGVWTKLDRLWLHAMDNQTEGLVDIVADASATAVNSPTFTANRGFDGFATSATYIDSNFNPTTAVSPKFVLNSGSIGSWVVVATSGSSFPDSIGQGDAPNGSFTDIEFDGTSYYGRINDNTILRETSSFSTGFINMVRTGASARAIYVNGSSSATDTTASKTEINCTITIAVRNDTGTPNSATNFQTGRLAASVIGGGLSATDASNLYSRLRTYMTAVGVP